MADTIKMFKYMDYPEAVSVIRHEPEESALSGFLSFRDKTEIRDVGEALPENNKICLVVGVEDGSNQKKYRVDGILKYSKDSENPIIGKPDEKNHLISFDNLYQASLYECLEQFKDNPAQAYMSLDKLIGFSEDDMDTKTFTNGINLANAFNSVYDVYRNRNTGELFFEEKKGVEKSKKTYEKLFLDMIKNLSGYKPEEFQEKRITEKNLSEER